MQLGLEKDETMLGKRFGKNIRCLILCSQIADVKILYFDLFSDEMIVNFNVFHPGMKNRIGGEISRTNVITS